MGASGKWLKSLITLKKPNTSNQARQNDKAGDRHKTKWRLWRSSSEGTKRGHALASKASDSSSDAFNVVIATVVRATPKDFMVIKRERAAIRIQTVFRGFLARQALRALKAVVRLQAIFRGRQVRKQAAVTLRCMQALVRVQARVRTRCVVTFPEELAMQKLMEEHRHFADPLKQAERGWCDSPGTVDEVRAKLQMRQEGALKRERAIAYSRSQQPARLTSSPRSRTNKPMTSPKYHRQNENISSYSWLERWMAAKPWESRLMTDPPELTPCRKRDDQVLSFHSSYSDHDSVKGRRNNGRTRISARPFSVGQVSSSSSAPSSESLYDESRASTSSTSASPSLVSSNTLSTTETGERNLQTPSYHNLTASTKAKHRTCKNLSESMEKHFKEDFLCHKKPMVISTGDARSSAGSSSSINFTKDLYAAIALAGHGRVR